MAGKRVVLTGGTDGIGKAAAIQLAALGANLTLMARDMAKGQRVAAEIRATGRGDAQIDVLPGDLSSLESVRAFAAEVNVRYEKIDALLNNAGTYKGTRSETVDGYETMFATNHLGPFLLTLELLDGALRGPARITFTASFAERFNDIRFDDLQSTREYRALAAYARTKRANLLFAYALARRLHGTGITVNAWHPGFVRSNIEGNRSSIAMRFATLFATTPRSAARTLVYLASSPTLEGVTGGYYSRLRPAKSSRGSHSVADQERLWQLSAELTHAPALKLA